MKAKTLITVIDGRCSTVHYPIVKSITPEVGISGMSLKEAKAYFYGYQGLTMNHILITSIPVEDRDFYSKL